MTLGPGEFFDVPQSNAYHDAIHTIAVDGITAGCSAGMYCPDASVLRSEMAVFLLKSEHGGFFYLPPPCTGIFADVECSPTPASAVNWIEQLYRENITGGCSLNPLSYCPAGPSTREQTAAFLVKTFGLVLYAP